MANGSIIIFSAASGGGKTTILDWLRQVRPQLVYSISATTRKPRPHEVDGIHYFFLIPAEFEKRIKNNEFAEWAQVHGNYYGTPKSFIDQNIELGRTVVMDIDVFGKAIFDTSYPDAIGIFLMPPDMLELERRLRSRNTDTEDVINLRLINAEKEIAYAKAEGKFEHFIVNDNLDTAQKDVLLIVDAALGAT